jgi:putative flippase GtrA
MSILHRFAQRARQIWRERGVLRKAITYALIGLINVAVDATVFFTLYATLTSGRGANLWFTQIVEACGCASVSTLTLIAANLVSWIVAVSGSYVMNSFITFAVESGRKLRWHAYGKFVASQIAGVVVNTTVLVLTAQVLPVWGAKGLAILAAYLVNFTLSNFVVFRPQRSGPVSR